MILFAAVTLIISNSRYIKVSFSDVTFLVKPISHFQFISRTPSKTTLGRMEDVIEPRISYRGSNVAFVIGMMPKELLDTADSRENGQTLKDFNRIVSDEFFLKQRHIFLQRLKTMDKKKRAVYSKKVYESGSDTYWTHYHAIWSNRLIFSAENSKWAVSVVLLGGTQLRGKAAYHDALREMLTIRPTPDQYKRWSKYCPLKAKNHPPIRAGG